MFFYLFLSVWAACVMVAWGSKWAIWKTFSPPHPFCMPYVQNLSSRQADEECFSFETDWKSEQSEKPSVVLWALFPWMLVLWLGLLFLKHLVVFYSLCMWDCSGIPAHPLGKADSEFVFHDWGWGARFQEWTGTGHPGKQLPIHPGISSCTHAFS